MGSIVHARDLPVGSIFRTLLTDRVGVILGRSLNFGISIALAGEEKVVHRNFVVELTAKPDLLNVS